MSEVDIDVEIQFRDKKTTELFYLFLSEYHCEDDCHDREKQLLSLLRLDAGKLFHAGRRDAVISAATMTDKGAVSFHVAGSARSGVYFWSKLQRLMLRAGPLFMYSVLCNHQVGEYALGVFNGESLLFYETGPGKQDEMLKTALSLGDPLPVFKKYYREDKIPVYDHFSSPPLKRWDLVGSR